MVPAITPGCTVLGVFAHPDDESLAAGGLLASAVQVGGRAVVVTATWAEDSGRAAELAEALAHLEAEPPRMLGYADARIPSSAPGRVRLVDADLDEVVAALVRHIRDVRPDVVVTHDGYGGLTGHEDHRRTHQVTVLAVRAAGLALLHPEAGEVWRTPATYLATHPHSAVPVVRDLVGTRRAVLSVPDDEVDLALDVRPWLDRKTAAVLAHRAEVERGALPGVVAGLGNDECERLLGTEWYALA